MTGKGASHDIGERHPNASAGGSPMPVTASVRSMSAVTATLCGASALVLAPLWAPLVLAAWFADLSRPAVRKLERVLGGRRRAAGAAVVLVVVGVLLPVVGIAFALATATQDLLVQVRAATEGQGSLASALLGGGAVGSPPQVRDWADLASRYGANAWRTIAVLAHASASAAIATIVFIAALYTFVVDGQRGYAWLEKHAPITPAELARLAGAFRETGRGLLIAGGGTALVQGVLATVAYVAIGIPRALILGPLTAVCALVPFVGTGLVWISLAIELAASEQYWRAGAVALMGAGVGVIDNFVRPLLARSGHLQLPTFVVLSSMLGGVAVFGPTGALLGPLLVRLCVESLAIVAERPREGSAREQAPSDTSGSPNAPENGPGALRTDG
jgi:predicted PurR-regulated permease PerM